MSVDRIEIHFPYGSALYAVNDEVLILDSPNPHLIGALFRVTGIHAADDTTAIRLPVERLA